MEKLLFTIALTGGIATGKSTCGTLLQECGYTIIDLDTIAHELLDENAATIAKLFGTEFIKKKRVLRKKLGALIFSDKNEKVKLENFLHPLIRKEALQKAQTQEKYKTPYFIDIPLFFEKQELYPVPHSVLVYTPKELQLQRLIKRSNFTLEEARQRVESQLDIERKRELADFIINNSGNLEELKQEVVRLHLWIKELYAHLKI